MNENDYKVWRQRAIKDYADDKVKAGNFTLEEALEQSNQEFNTLLPDGINSEDNHLFNLMDKEKGEDVGKLWVKKRSGGQELFIYDIRIHKEYRGQGYGKQTMHSLEDWAKEKGIPKISLHVFGHNETALNLYRKVGFVATNVLMSKIIEN